METLVRVGMSIDLTSFTDASIILSVLLGILNYYSLDSNPETCQSYKAIFLRTEARYQ